MSTSKDSKALAESQRHNEQLFDQMSRLNNQLVNLQRELAIKNARLEELNEQKNQLLGMATHDLRNPLAAIISGCRLIERDAVSGDKLKNTVQEIHRISGFMLHLVEDLLDLSKIESRKLGLAKALMDITGMLTYAVNFHRPQAESKDIKLSLELQGALPSLDIDARKMEQVLENLISNAIKFSPKGSEVKVKAERVVDELVIRVEDQGPGIPEQEQSKLFKPFSRTSVRPTGGESSSGLGLSIAKKIVEAHQGRIWVESQLGVGSHFVFALPI